MIEMRASGAAPARLGRARKSLRPRRAAAASASGGATEVFVARTPLVGLEAIGDVLGDLYPGPLEHSVVILREAGGTSVVAHDFLPEDPTDPRVALALLSGGSTKGVVRSRPLRGVPRRRCEGRGLAGPGAARAAQAFDEAWDTELRLRTNDCHAYADALVAHLTRDAP